MKPVAVVVVCMASLVISSCSDADVQCSSDAAKQLISQIIGESFAPGFASQNIDAKKSTYSVSAVRTTGDVRNGVACGALLSAKFKTTDDWRQFLENTPGLESPDQYASKFNFEQVLIEYTVERTDDKQLFVEVKPFRLP